MRPMPTFSKWVATVTPIAVSRLSFHVRLTDVGVSRERLISEAAHALRY